MAWARKTCFNSTTIDSIDEIPNNFDSCQDSVYVNLTLSQTLDMTNYEPIGLCKGGIIRVRLASTSGGGTRLIWNDYQYVDNVGDTISFQWDGANINII